ncbi:MAG: PAS domain-containing protein [Cyclobacteriaceae bacterium]|nr:PAS domain-containing protein [Cyclobacteriaceae bacterium]MCH8517210.1 PAS domain-containing protein [Cyclobacteriaceae bacterium]
MIDILETERIKNEIAESPQDVLDIIESTDSIGICITNRDMNFVAVNTAYTKIYGYDKDTLVGGSFLIVVPEANKEKMKSLHDKFLKDKKELAREWEVQGSDGNLIKISVDAGYSDKIFDQTPHKITFVHKE